MSEKKKKLPTIVTPAGTLQYPWLGKPDAKFDPNKPVYRTRLILDKNDSKVQEFLQKLTVLAEEALAVAKKEAKTPQAAKVMTLAEPYVDELDAEGNETGNVIVRFKMNAQYTDPTTGKTTALKPAVFDSKNKPMDPTKVQIGGGSTAQVAFQAMPYYNASSKSAGVTLRIQGVRILNLVTFGGRDGASMFGAAAEGYEDESDSTDSPGFGSGDSDEPSGSGSDVEDF